MWAVTELKCVTCGAAHDPKDVRYTCPTCGDQVGLLDVVYDWERVRERLSRESLAADPDPTIRRYLPLLPVSGEVSLPPVSVGGTPLYTVPSLAALAGVQEVRVKDDGRNPTGSLKDRASAICLVRAMELGEPLITAASTGNAASSLSGLAASVGMRTVIFVPKTAPRAKVAQLLIYGARVVQVDGNYDDACDLSLQATREFGWYSRNTGFNPYLLEGKKTVSLELAEQYGWDVPDRVFVGTGDGCILGGVWKGFHDLLQLGLIERMPRLVAVQAEGSAAISRAFLEGAEPFVPDPHTVADSISVGRPRAAAQALRALRDSHGDAVIVSDDEILEAMRILARHSGVFGEPAGATPLAGLLKMARAARLAPDERVAVLVTGNGLKDVDGAMQATDSIPSQLQADPEALRTWCRGLLEELHAPTIARAPGQFVSLGSGLPAPREVADAEKASEEGVLATQDAPAMSEGHAEFLPPPAEPNLPPPPPMAPFAPQFIPLSDGREVELRVACDEDMDEIKAAYYAAYGGRYTLSEVNDRDKMKWCINDPNYLWLICVDVRRVVCSVLFVVDPFHRIAKTFAGVVHPDYRGQKLMMMAIRHGRDFLTRDRASCDLIYAVVRTFVSPTFHADLQELGFIDLGVFPNVRKLKSYETHGFKVYFARDALEKRRRVPHLIAPVARIYEIGRDRLGLEEAEVCNVTLEPRPPVERHDMVIERGREVEWEYYRERDAGHLYFSYVPFHYPLIKVHTRDQSKAAYIFYQEADGHASLLGLKSSGDFIVRDLLSIEEYAESMGVKYLEMLISAYDPLMQKLAYEAGFLPCAYFPGARMGENGEREDYVVTCCTFVPPHFKGLRMTPETRPYLSAYYRIYTKKLWEDMQ